LGIDGEEPIDGCYQPDRAAIVRMGFHRLEEVPPGADRTGKF
jgi:hypothetical protein